MISDWILSFCLALNCYMAGTEWITQLVSFPMLALVGTDSFSQYHAAIMKRIILPIAVPGLLTLILSMLLIWLTPLGIPSWSVWLLLILQVIPILSTVFIQLPKHNKLTEKGFDEVIIASLVQSQWLRTISVTFSALLLVWMIVLAIYQ